MIGVRYEVSFKIVKKFVLSDSMQQNQGSPEHKSDDSPTRPTKMPQCVDMSSTGHVNPSTYEGGYAASDSNLISSECGGSGASTFVQQQPETLNLPAVLWDKPVGSKIRVPPPVPPRSPRKPIDPVASGAFESAMAMPYDGGASEVNNAPQRGWQMGFCIAL